MALGDPGQGGDDAGGATEKQEDDRPQLAALPTTVGFEAEGMNTVVSGQDM